MSTENKKIKTYIEKITSDETTLKRIPFYLFLLGVLVIVLIFELRETNKYLKMIAENGNVIVETQTKDENYDSVLNIYTEEPSKIEDILPNPNENITKPNDSQETNISDENTENYVRKQTYVINISSKKIHKPDCSFVSRTKAENKKTVTLSDDELKNYINNGHQICKTCGG